MAKWGEGDPRWIVEDRPDAVNVNNWHWTVKDASAWSKDKLKSFLTSINLENSEIGSWKLSDIVASGEASVSNRKGKLIILYDWAISGKLTSTTCGGDGSVDIRNFSYENTLEDIEIALTLKSGDCAHDVLLKVAKAEIIVKLQDYVHMLTSDFSQGLMLPTSQTSSEVSKVVKKDVKLTTVSSTDSSNTVGLKILTKKVKLSESFKCSVEDLFNVFIVEELIQAYTRSKASVNGQKGGQFSMLGGQITGEYVQLERPKKIVQKWRAKEWPDGHFSLVTLEFYQEDDGTKLTLLQTGIPSTEHERTRDGWKNFIFEPIKATFGYGARLL